MAKKKKEICPYCGNSFAYLNRHKCKVKERVEGPEEPDKSQLERRIERIEEKKKDSTRHLKKDEKFVLDIIQKKKNMYFEELLELTELTRNELDDTLELLILQSKINIKREMVEASWTKLISITETLNEKVGEHKIDMSKKDFILDFFSFQPCLICPFSSKCNDTNLDQFNPTRCPWLTEWIYTSISGDVYKFKMDELLDGSAP
ncbi:MAG: hypothetical protein KGD73_02025 [Candidatus Lokiarchaeota archaeon]|nr:hypothetical protein [Candidatus Lokiarchaeota archaeon]